MTVEYKDLVVKMLDRTIDDITQRVDRFKARVANCNVGQMYFVLEDVENVMSESAKLAEAHDIRRTVIDTTVTIEELQEELTRWLKESINRVLEDGYRHNCTSAVVNVGNQCKFRALQWRVTYLMQILSGDI